MKLTVLLEEEPVMTKPDETFEPFSTRLIPPFGIETPAGEAAVKWTPSAGFTKIVFKGERPVMT